MGSVVKYQIEGVKVEFMVKIIVNKVRQSRNVSHHIKIIVGIT